MEIVYINNNLNELYRKIAKEVWKHNPYIDLKFPKNPYEWLTVKAHVFYKGNCGTFGVYVKEKPDQIDDNFIKGLTRSLMDNINMAIEERNKENVNE